jgi:hypothetical protein
MGFETTPPLGEASGMRRCVPFVRFLLSLAACALMVAVAEAQYGTPEAAAKYRAGGLPVKALADGTIVAEAEEFQVAPTAAGVKPGWQARGWGENYYVASFANAFLSRQAFLGAPEQTEGSGGSAATIEVQVPKPGRYLALVRYEAAYRFETQFTLKVQQAGQTKLNRLYGARKNLKIWAFGEKLKTEVAWSWGAGENVVWEGHDAYVDLEPGPARLTLIAEKQPEPAAKRNVDLVMLTADEAQVKERIAKENYLPLDGMLTQEGDVYVKLHNRGTSKLTLTLPPCTEHSPYWVHIRRWKSKTITAEPGASNAEGWIEVGSLLDTLNDGQWTLSAASADKSPPWYSLEIGVTDADGKIALVKSFEADGPQLALGFFGDTRYRRQMRTTDQLVYDLLLHLKKQPVQGKLPQRTPVYAYTFNRRPDDPRYNTAVDEFIGLFNLSTTDLSRPGTAGQPRGYVDVRGDGDLEKKCQEFVKQGVADKIAVVSLGDEIGLAAPPATDHDGFRRFLQAERLKPSDVDPAAGDEWAKINYTPAADKAKQPRLFYYARRYQHHFGIQAIKARTDVLRKHLPQAGIGANYSPHHGYHYLGEVHQWITLFRRGGMTMPWSEDYIWQVPVGTQQMNFIGLDMFRAAIKGQPGAKIMWYVMPHSPGNTPAAWRRQFYGDLAHGMQRVNLFEFRPVQAAYTENYCNDPANYVEIRKSLHELGQFEDIVQDGRVQPGVAALWFSETADIWDDNRHPFAAAKRSLYIAIRHLQLPLDFVIDEDAMAGDLKNYRVLYLADRHVSRAASQKIADWVAAGGRLVATAGAGMFDEFNEPNAILQKLLGVQQKELLLPADANVVFEKQDLPFSKPLDTVAYGISKETLKVPVIAAKARFLLEGEAASAVANFADGSPAVTERRVGQGSVVYFGFLPGLSYFKPAMPLRPVDRGATAETMAHFIPTQFDRGSAALLARATADIESPVFCSQPLVESSILQSPAGAAIPLVNWSGGPVKGLQVTVRARLPSRQVALASGNAVQIRREGESLILTLDLDEADAIVLR